MMMQEDFIGNYKVLRKIGAGGTAQVFLAVHKDVPNLKVILKILSDSRLQERFLQEADKLAFLDGHSSICQIKHFFSHGDEMVIAMEFIDGDSLDKKVKQAGQMAAAEAVEITCTVLQTLKFAHAKGICHRDIKPSNIMIDSRGNTKIIDFGIAKAETDPNMTAVGTACGTPTYMAPEQFTPSPDTNYSLVDVYAAGTTLYNMLTGHVPFTGDNPFAIRDAKLFDEPPSPKQYNSHIPNDLEKVILTAIARDPDQRYQSAQEFIDALRGTSISDDLCTDHADTTQQIADIHDSPTLVTSPSLSTDKSRSKLWIGLAAAAVLAAVIVIAFWPREDPSSGATRDPIDDRDEFDTAVVETVLAEPEFGTIKVLIHPKGDVYVDDSLVEKGVESIEFEYEAGRRVVTVKNSRSIQKMFVDTVWVTPGFVIERSHNFTFKADPVPPPPPRMGQVMIGSSPRKATVYIDGKKQDEETIMTFPVTATKHDFRVELLVGGEMRTADTSFIVEENGDHRISFDLRK